MKTQPIDADFCVVGGGMAGICAAIAAARGGARTVLIQDRPVLGGNNSSEIRVWISGATAGGSNRFARETGILGELYLENLFRNPEANAHLQDALLLEWVTREPNLTLLLDTAAFECEPADRRTIRSVTAFCSLNQVKYVVSAPLFADTSGDGILGFLAGADFRMGRESRDEYGEPWAPAQADELTLGDSMFFHTRRADHPVRFVPPAFALDLEQARIAKSRVARIAQTAEPFGCELWWIEYGGTMHTIYQADEIKHHLTRIVYGVWDHIKNSGEFDDVDNLTLEWVGSYPGKRESRRFLGPVVLRQQDVIGQRAWPDAIGAGGWSIDLHPAEGIYCDDAPSMHDHADWLYNFPFRTLYSRNVDNLLLAGRLMSASHVAFGSIRVMGTCAVGGQAVGTAAVQCLEAGCRPRNLADDPAAVSRLQQRLLRDGQHIVGLRNADRGDLARSGKVAASSTAVLDQRSGDGPVLPLAPGQVGLMLPIADPATRWVELLLGSDRPTRVTARLQLNDKAVNYRPNVDAGQAQAELGGEGPRWVRFDLPKLDAPQNVWMTLGEAEGAGLHCIAPTTAGVLLQDPRHRQRHAQRYYHSPCLRLERPQRLYEPDNVVDGVHRPEMFPHAWVSGPLADGTQWIQIELASSAAIGHVQVTLNADVNRHIFTHLEPADRNTIPEMLRDFDVELIGEGGDVAGTIQVRDNHQRVVRVDGGGVRARRVRVTCHAAWDHDRAEIHELRVYAP